MEHYEIIVLSHMDPRREREFHGLKLEQQSDGNTRLHGTLRDQAELYAVLQRIRDLNLTLQSLKKNDKYWEETI